MSAQIYTPPSADRTSGPVAGRKSQDDDNAVRKGAISLALGALGAALLYRRSNRHPEEDPAPARGSRAGQTRRDDRLATYLHDHLAGAKAALNMLDRLSENNRGQPLGRFADDLLAEVEEDDAVLQEIADQLGGGRSGFKESVARLSATVAAQVKTGTDELGSFEALETLGLGIRGKLALWRALAAIAPHDSRLTGYDFNRLADRAESQHAEVEDWRLRMASQIFGRGERRRSRRMWSRN